jgi:hypothetical protein
MEKLANYFLWAGGFALVGSMAFNSCFYTVDAG